MSRTNLEHINVGDKLAVRRANSLSTITHRLLIVDRLAGHHVICRDAKGGGGEWRFIKATGKQVGETYRYAEIATPELVAAIENQSLMNERRIAAMSVVSSITSQALQTLTVPQMEALAKAWIDIKAMGTAAANAADSQNPTACGHPL